MVEPKPVEFYSDLKNEYSDFSNFAMTSINIDGQVWPSVEHYYQAMKFMNTDPRYTWYRDLIRQTNTANKAKQLGGQKITGRFSGTLKLGKGDGPLLKDIIAQSKAYGIEVRPDWEEKKEEVMRKALQAKFSQHPNLRKRLLDTGEAVIKETSPRDNYWGTGSGNGRNRLGVLLMELRNSMRSESKVPMGTSSSTPVDTPVDRINAFVTKVFTMVDSNPLTVSVYAKYYTEKLINGTTFSPEIEKYLSEYMRILNI